MKNNRMLLVSYGKSNEDIPVLTVAENALVGTVILNSITGDKATEIYEQLIDNNKKDNNEKDNNNDNEEDKIKEICRAAGVDDIDDVSDGYHTFNNLYYQRMILFAVIVSLNKDLAWKSYKHNDGTLCFGGGWFIVGISTPKGDFTYHYKNEYYDYFDCKELEVGKKWDGHTEYNIARLFSLCDEYPEEFKYLIEEVATYISPENQAIINIDNNGQQRIVH